MADAYRIIEFAVITGAGVVSIRTESCLKPHIPARNIKGVGHSNAALDEVIAEMIRVDGQFSKWEQPQREETTIVATKIQFEARRNSIETGLASNCSSVEILEFFGAKGGEDQLKIKVIEEAGLDVHGRD